MADKVIHAELALYTTECYPDIRVDLHRVDVAVEPELGLLEQQRKV